MSVLVIEHFGSCTHGEVNQAQVCIRNPLQFMPFLHRARIIRPLKGETTGGTNPGLFEKVCVNPSSLSPLSFFLLIRRARVGRERKEIDGSTATKSPPLDKTITSASRFGSHYRTPVTWIRLGRERKKRAGRASAEEDKSNQYKRRRWR